MKWYDVTEVTVDGYSDTRHFLKYENAERYIQDNPNLNLEGPNVINTDTMYFEDKNE